MMSLLPSQPCDNCITYSSICIGCAIKDITLCENKIIIVKKVLHSTESRRKKEGYMRQIKGYYSTIKVHTKFIQSNVGPDIAFHLKYIFDEFATDVSHLYRNGAADALATVARDMLGTDDFLYNLNDEFLLDITKDLKIVVKEIYDLFSTDVSVIYRNGALDALAAFARRIIFTDDFLYVSDVMELTEE